MSQTPDSKDNTSGGRGATESSTVVRRRAALVFVCALAAFAIAFGIGHATKSTSAVRTTDSLAPVGVNRTAQHVSITGVRVADAPKLRPAPKPKQVATSSTTAAQTVTSSPVQTPTTQVQPTPVQPTPVQPTPVQPTPAQPTQSVTTQQGGLSGGGD